MKMKFTSVAACFAVAATALPAMAAEPSGVVVASVPSAQADGPGGRRAIHASSDVFMGDKVVTGAFGEAQIRMADNTRLVVGKNSTLLIDEFVYSGASANKVTINAVRGAFRFITGNSRKTAYKITTPTATIGIRGTEFDFSVVNGKTSVALLSGSLDLCDRNRRCIRLEGACSIAETDRRRRPEEIELATLGARQLSETFPYLRSQSGLWRDFRVSGAGNCTIRRARIDNTEERRTRVAALPPQGGPPPPPGNEPPVIPGDDPPGEVSGGNKGPGNGGEGGEGPVETQNPAGINEPPGLAMERPGNSGNAPGHNKN